MTARKEMKRIAAIDTARETKTVIGHVASVVADCMDVVAVLTDIRDGTRPGMKQMPEGVRAMFQGAASRRLERVAPAESAA